MGKKSAVKKTIAKPETVLVLRTCDEHLKAYGGFQWPESGMCEAPDWDPDAHCGQGLHGLLKGEGDSSMLSWQPSAKWMVVEVVKSEIVDLKGKVKFPRGRVVYVGDRTEAANMIAKAHPEAAVIAAVIMAGNYGKATAGNYGKATAGNYGKATAGYSGTATAGYSGTATAGDSGTATAGESGTATAGNYGKATAGNYGKATAGYSGTATAGYSGTATAGNYGKATAGNYGKATAGDSGTATAGNYGKATAGKKGIIQILYWDRLAKRDRIVTGYVGEDGIEPGKVYKLDDSHKLVRV